MRVVFASTARFHFIDAARELKKLGMLGGVVTGLLRSRVGAPELEDGEIVCVPFYRTLNYLALNRLPESVNRWLEKKSNAAVDYAASCFLNSCDALVTMAGTGLEAGRTIQRQGGKFLIDRPVVHIREQDELLRREYEALGLSYRSIDQEKIASQEEEYERCDAILVCSTMVAQSLVNRGVPRQKIVVLPLGVELQKFYREGLPNEEQFTLGFAGAVGIQKGIHVLAKAVKRLKDSRLRIWIAGQVAEESRPFLRELEAVCTLEVLGPISQDSLRKRLSESNAFVLPSIQDGFGMVVTQAMACGCPVIVSRNAGVSEIIKEEETGLLFDSGDFEALAHQIDRLREQPEWALSLGEGGTASVKSLGGWSSYGDGLAEAIKAVINN